MNDPLPPLPPLPPPDPTKSWLDELAKWRPVIMSIVALATAIWLSISAWIQNNKADKNIQIAEQTKDVATDTRLDAKKVIVNALDDPQDKRELQQLEAATQNAAQQK